MRARPKRSALVKVLVRVHLLLWIGFIIGLTLAIAFREIGVRLCLILYVTSVACVVLLMLRALGRFKQRPVLQGPTATVALLFVTDATAGVALLLGFVLQAASANYGQVYGRVGFAFVLMAGVAWAATFIAALRIYFRTGNRMVVALFCCYFWISVVAAFDLLTDRQYWGF